MDMNSWNVTVRLHALVDSTKYLNLLFLSWLASLWTGYFRILSHLYPPRHVMRALMSHSELLSLECMRKMLILFFRYQYNHEIFWNRSRVCHILSNHLWIMYLKMKKCCSKYENDGWWRHWVWSGVWWCCNRMNPDWLTLWDTDSWQQQQLHPDTLASVTPHSGIRKT